MEAESKANTLIKPGFFKGRHFTTYVEEAKQLKREGKYKELEILLWNLVKATEEESKFNKIGVAPWYYEELAKLYRKNKDYYSEVMILERFANKRHHRGAKPPILLKRLERAKILLNQSLNWSKK